MNNKSSGEELLKYIESLPTSSNGLYDYPGQNVVVPTGGNITMEGIDYPVLGISMETGEEQLMQPGGSYDFDDTDNVLEVPQYQNGGAIGFFNSYIKSPKYSERLRNSGDYIPQRTIQNRLNNLNSINPVNYITNGESEYQDAFKNININRKEIQDNGYDLGDILTHEYAHGVGAVEPNLYNGGYAMSKNDISNIEKRTSAMPNSSDWGELFKNRHDRMPTEIKADVDTLRYKMNKDGLYDAGTQDFKRQDLDKANKKYKDNEIFKRLKGSVKSDEDLMWIMNNIASNNKDKQPLFYAQDGGKIYTQDIDPVVMTNLGNYTIGLDDINGAIQLPNYERPGESTFKNYDEHVLNQYRDWGNLEDFSLVNPDGDEYVPSQEFGQDDTGNYVDMRMEKFFPNGDNFYNRTYLPNNLQEQIELQGAYQKSRGINASEMPQKTPYTEGRFESDKNFMRDYIGSDDYRNLLSNYYPDAKREQADRLARLGSVELELMPQKELQALTKQNEKNVMGFVATAGDGYNSRNVDPRYSAFNIDPRELNRKTFSRNEVDMMTKGNVVSEPQRFLDEFKGVIGDGVNNKAVNLADRQSNQTGIHELGHFVRNAVSPNQFQDILKRTKNVGGIEKLLELPNGRFAPVDYVRTPTEITSRLDAMRYLLKENGVKDTTKSLELSEKELKKALENPKIKADGNVQDLINSTNNAQDLLWLLNNIVDNGSKPGQDLRQYLG